MPPLDPEVWSQISQRLLAWHRNGYLPATPARTLRAIQTKREPWPPESAKGVLDDLRQQGAPVTELLAILRGRRGPHLDVVRLYRQWLIARRTRTWAGQRRKAVVRLMRRYRSLATQLRRDSGFSARFREHASREFESIEHTFAWLLHEDSGENLDGFSVGLTRDFSRHGFWNPVISALVEALPRRDWSGNRAFAALACLLAAVFPEAYPANPNLVKQRFYRARRPAPKTRA
jgi:hypothetical protein